MKRIADTSRAAFREWLPQRSSQESMVLAAIAAYRWTHHEPPTARELLAFVQLKHPGLDVNGVRPNLTRLEDSGEVAKGAKRRCSMTGKLVYTWDVVRPRAAAAASDPAPSASEGQRSFFSEQEL